VELQGLGFFTYVGGQKDPTTALADTLELFEAADQLGYDSMWVAQHHFGPPVGTLPSPLPLLAAAATKTRRLRLGTAVVILPLENPVRLAEDASVVDLLSGGRLELGLGSGTDPGVFEAFGIDPERRHDLMRAGLESLLSTLAGSPLPTGQFLHPHSPGLDRRVWQGVASPERAIEAARQGTNLLLPKASTQIASMAATQQALVTQAFLDAWRQPWPARVALSRPVYPSQDRASAQQELADELDFLSGYRDRLTGLHKGSAASVVEDYIASGVFHLGSIDDIIGSLSADPALPLATSLICQVGHQGPGQERTLRAMEMIATRVAPALGWRPKV
jgi:alkanesulfonate monooxygenase SsuD/methylene tetrahydromethanopterin reductase-like flavin-dependent oxidoreductase (luciferase family)